MSYRLRTPLKAAAPSAPVLTLVHWYDPSLPLTQSAGLISSVPNQVGGGPAAVQSSATLKPLQAPLVDTGDGTSALNAMTFDGVDDRLEVTLPATISQFLMMLFVVPASVTANRALIGTRTGGTQAPLLQMGATSGKINVLLAPGGVVAQAGGTNLTTGNPFVIGAAYDGTTLRINHYNGAGAGTSVTAGVALTSGQTFYIGGAPGRTSYSGQIADVQVWKNWNGDAAALNTELQNFFNTTLAKYYP